MKTHHRGLWFSFQFWDPSVMLDIKFIASIWLLNLVCPARQVDLVTCPCRVVWIGLSFILNYLLDWPGWVRFTSRRLNFFFFNLKWFCYIKKIKITYFWINSNRLKKLKRSVPLWFPRNRGWRLLLYDFQQGLAKWCWWYVPILNIYSWHFQINYEFSRVFLIYCCCLVGDAPCLFDKASV